MKTETKVTHTPGQDYGVVFYNKDSWEKPQFETGYLVCKLDDTDLREEAQRFSQVLCWCPTDEEAYKITHALNSNAELLEQLKLALPILEGANSRCTHDSAFIINVRAAISKAEAL